MTDGILETIRCCSARVFILPTSIGYIAHSHENNLIKNLRKWGYKLDTG